MLRSPSSVSIRTRRVRPRRRRRQETAIRTRTTTRSIDARPVGPHDETQEEDRGSLLRSRGGGCATERSDVRTTITNDNKHRLVTAPCTTLSRCGAAFHETTHGTTTTTIPDMRTSTTDIDTVSRATTDTITTDHPPSSSTSPRHNREQT